ncbi:MAG TPA: FAD-binding oxidoreductase [Streptosporangiaceae bacterium]|nr:FAD-binding oxidoreductase [Streptosporangiaceae bacterium]
MDTGPVPAAAQTAAAAGPGNPGRRSFLLMAGAVIGAGTRRPSVAMEGADAAGRRRSAALASRPQPAWPARPGAHSPTMADWQALRRKLSTRHLVRPGQPGYGLARQLYDPRFDSLAPQAVAYCGTPDDVAACLSFVTRFRLPVRARSGGHSYAGWSSVTGGLIIDVTPLSSLRVGSGTVQAGTGLALIDFYAGLAAHGLAVPGGTCPTVGLAGLTLGGGVGILSRLYGLTSDNLTAVQLVTADGSVLTASPSRHSDLFWACQGGGGGNFGVATSFTFRTHKLGQIVLFNLTWPWSLAAQVVSAWQSWAPNAPDALWSSMHLSARPGGSPRLNVDGAYAGSVASATALLDQLFAAVGSAPSSSVVRQDSFLNAMLMQAGCGGLSVTECHTQPGGKLLRVPSFAKSDFFSTALSTAGIQALLTAVQNMTGVTGAAGGAGEIGFDAFGGALNRIRPADTAFVHRNSLFNAQYRTSWTNPGSGQGVANQHAWLRSFYASLHPYANGQAYQNYPDPDLTDWRQAYYGANYPRLSAIKARYDPHMLFRFPQAITPA